MSGLLLCPTLWLSALAGLVVWLARLCIPWYKSYRDRVRCLEKFPSLPRHWLLGSLKSFRGGTNFFKMHQERVERFPYCYIVWNGRTPQLMVQHPDTIKPILNLSDPKHKVYKDYLQPWLGKGLLIAEGHVWFRNRRLLTPAFHFEVLKSYIKIFNETSETFINKLSTISKEGHDFEVFNHISLLTLDSLLKCAFSLKSECQTTGDGNPYVKAVFELTSLFSRRMGRMLDKFFPWMYWLSSEGRKYAYLCDVIHRHADDVIQRRRKQLQENEAKCQSLETKSLDFLDILLTARDEDGNGLTPLEIRSEVDTFMFEGHDTTASGLSWTLYVLARHPQYQHRVQEELDCLLEGRQSSDILWGDLSRLPYLTQCLKESLRFYSPVPVIGRTLTRDIQVQDQRVPAGTMVIVPIYALHHNPVVWGDDHMTYDPDRFSPENSQARDPFAYLPFSAGPRNCIGQTFALNEMKVILGRLLHRFTFEVSENSPSEAPIMTVVMRNNQDIRLRAVPRKLSCR